MEDLTWYLKYMVEQDASDIYITVGVPPMFRIEGIVYPYGGDVLGPDDTEAMAYRAMNERQRKIFEESPRDEFGSLLSRAWKIQG